jgi:CBS domain-containing protein
MVANPLMLAGLAVGMALFIIFLVKTSPKEKKVKEIMRTDVVTCEKSLTTKEAAKIMNNKKIGSVVVVDGDKPVGILTEKDITRLEAKDKDLEKTAVGDVMSSPLITVSKTELSSSVAERMVNNGVKRLPVVENGKLIGILTHRELVAQVPHLAKRFERGKVLGEIKEGDLDKDFTR